MKSFKKPPFTPVKLEDERSPNKEILPIRLNSEERLILDQGKKLLRQHKDSTALKAMAMLGYAVLQDKLTGQAIDIIFKNKRKNRQSGYEEI